jgi:N-acyl-D-amino-acid deacylase
MRPGDTTAPTPPTLLSRRAFLASTGQLAAGLAVAGPPLLVAAPAFDLVIKGGTILDGTGGPPFPADVGLVGDRIEFIGTISSEQGRRVLDASGLSVAPGFIDIHTHSDGTILAYPTADSRVRQGVTTEVTGNCGGSAAPVGGPDSPALGRELSREGPPATWSDVASYCALLERTRIATNQVLLVGQGTLRRNLVGLVNRPLTPDELQAEIRSLEEALDQGVFGLSTGLEYTPGRFTPTDEIVALARVVARRGGLYASHIRNEEALLLEAVDEAIAIGRQTGVRVQISHLKAAGRPNWPKQRGALGLIETARRDGIAVLADAYPYTAYSTGLTIFLPDWALEGGAPAILARLRDPAARARIRREVGPRIANDPGSADLIVIARVESERNRALVGETLAAIAARWKLDPVEALLKLLEEEETSVSYIGHAMSPENVELVLAHPLVMIGSDGSSLAPVGRAAAARPHPRSYGAYARVLAHYVRERRLLDLTTAIKKMTSMPADQIGLRDRGRIARGLKADLVAFDLAQVQDRATFEDPHQYAAGFVHVLVNGVPVVEGGQPTGARPGQVLRRP